MALDCGDATSWIEWLLSSASSPAEARALITSQAKAYVTFLRNGVKCVCGMQLPQPLFRALAPRAPEVAGSRGLSKNNAGSAFVGVVVLDDESPAACAAWDSPPPGTPPNPVAEVIICPACTARFCAACGMHHLPSASTDVVVESIKAPSPPSFLPSEARRTAANVVLHEPEASEHVPSQRRGQPARVTASTAATTASPDDDCVIVGDDAPATVSLAIGPFPAFASVVRSGEGSSSVADEAAHGAKCTLRRVHAVAVCIELMRRALAGTFVPPPLPDVYQVAERALARAGNKATRRKPGNQVFAATSAAARSAAIAAQAALRTDFSSPHGKSTPFAALISALVDVGVIVGSAVESMKKLLVDSSRAVRGGGGGRPPHPSSKVSCNVSVSSSSDCAYGDDVEEPDEDDSIEEDDLDNYYFASAQPAHNHCLASGGPSSALSRKGTGFAGSAGDELLLKENERKQAAARVKRDALLYALTVKLRDALPVSVFGPNGWAPVRVATSAVTISEEDDEISLLSSGKGGAASSSVAGCGATTPSHVASHVPTVELVRGTVTDKASDHPLLAAMLLLPGFGEGLPLVIEPRPLAGGVLIAAARAASEPATSGVKRKRGASMAAKTTTAAATTGISASSSLGDGLCGRSPLYAMVSELLRSSILEVSKFEVTRQLFFTVLQVLSRAARHPLLGGVLLFSEEASADAAAAAAAAEVADSASLAPVRPRGTSSSAAPPPTFAAWSPAISAVSTREGALRPSPSSMLALLAALKKQADVFIKTANARMGSSEVLVGSITDEAEFTSVLCLSRDLESAAETAATGVHEWVAVQRALADAFVEGEDEAEEASGAAKRLCLGVDGSVDVPPPSRIRRRSVVASAAPATTAARPPSSATLSVKELIDRSRGLATASRTTDPVLSFGIGKTKVAFEPPADVVGAYEATMRDEAYNTVDGLRATHYHGHPGSSGSGSAGAGAGAGAGGVAGASSMKRHMRVSAEMANLPSLAVNYPSSILVRQDEASIDFLRAMMTGPADTPYANGVFLFDIFLPPSYPQVNPRVTFLTTGGGLVRFNPNLYADGKVCLSLLGTWAGPGWDPAISTLSQVLVSIQAQIMNEAPYYNECVRGAAQDAETDVAAAC